MIHPDTELRRVNEIIGYGVFARRFIPRGTIVYVKDSLEIEVTPAQFEAMDPQLQTIVNWFSYIDETGSRIVSWDIAKYVNHNCRANTISTGYGFEIAIRDIAPGEEITDEYGIFNLPEALQCRCGADNCRGVISQNDWDVYGRAWDKYVRDALKYLPQVAQPLMKFIDTRVYHDLMRYLNSRRHYRSLRCLRMATDKAVEKIC